MGITGGFLLSEKSWFIQQKLLYRANFIVSHSSDWGELFINWLESKATRSSREKKI